MVIAEVGGVLPWHPWHAAAALLLALTMLVVNMARRRCKTARHLLLHPSHVAEIAMVLEPKTVSPEVTIQTTSLGVQIGIGQLQEDGAITYHYSLSARDGQIGEATARTLADLITKLRPAAHTSEFVVGQQSMYHLLLHPGSQSARLFGQTRGAVA